MWGWREGGDRGWEREAGGGALLTCLMAVTVMTKNKGRPLVTGLVGVSTITWWEKEAHAVLGHNTAHMKAAPLTARESTQDKHLEVTGAGVVSLWPFCCSKFNHQVRKTQVFNICWEVLHSCHELMSMLGLCSSKVALSLIKRTSADFQIAADAALKMISLG